MVSGADFSLAFDFFSGQARLFIFPDSFLLHALSESITTCSLLSDPKTLSLTNVSIADYLPPIPQPTQNETRPKLHGQ